ncbi:MAG: hypothetical protein JXP34_01415 [Planctomycetes bacterium]|nr:hypothetical protein [Planctomycetota bacterium]
MTAGFLLSLSLAWNAPARAQQPAGDAEPFNFEEATRDIPKPREVYPYVKRDMIPMDLKIISDEMVTSDTDPSKKLRKITAHFNSLKLEGRVWGHPCVIFTPADKSVNPSPERKGKVVIVGSPGWAMFPAHVEKYGEPIATRTGYPTMVLSSPGVHPDGSGIEGENMQVLTRMREATGTNFYNMNCQLALIYIRAMDVMEKVLDVDRVQAVIGGHSKRGRSATVAAAMDSRVASPIIMGNEGIYRTDEVQWHLSFHHAFFQDQVDVPVFYIGATNEGGYDMFNINLMQERLKRPMTIEMIPNYRHYNFHEIQFIDFMMWVAHILDGRPVSKIVDMSHEYRNGRNYYRAKVESEAKIQLVRTWFVYADNPQWRDLMWFEWIMQKNGDYYETSVPGRKVDAYMIEVADTAMGFPGYVTSLPIKVTDKPVEPRRANEAGWMGPPEAKG